MLTTTIFGGNSTDSKVKNGAVVDFSMDSVVGAEIAFSNDYGKIRAGYIQSEVTSNAVVPHPDLAMDESGASFYGVGLNGDYEDFHIAAEYIVRDMDETGSPDINSYYAMLGYTIGDFTPNYTYAVADSDMEFSSNPMVNGGRAMNLDDRTSHTIGLRYEVNAQAALKIEYNMATVTTSTYAGGTNLTETDEDANTMRVALNVIF